MSNNRQTAMANCEIIVLPRTVRQKNYAPHSTLISEKYEVIEIKTVHKNGYRSLNRSQLFVFVQKEFLFALCATRKVCTTRTREEKCNLTVRDWLPIKKLCLSFWNKDNYFLMHAVSLFIKDLSIQKFDFVDKIIK